MHQSAPGNLWRAVCVGVRKRRPRTEGASRWPARLQRHCADAQCGAGGIRLGVCAGGCGAAAFNSRAAKASARGLVPAVSGISPLLPEPPSLVTRVLTAGRCAALPALAQRDQLRVKFSTRGFLDVSALTKLEFRALHVAAPDVHRSAAGIDDRLVSGVFEPAMAPAK